VPVSGIVFLWWWMTNWNFFSIASGILDEIQMFDPTTSMRSLFVASVLSGDRDGLPEDVKHQ
jgi:hypothetical protein